MTNMNWYRKATEYRIPVIPPDRAYDRGSKYRRLPFAPIAPDPSFYVSGEFSSLVRVLEDVMVETRDWRDFNHAVDELKKMTSDAKDESGFIKSLRRLEKIGAGGDREDYQKALAAVQLAFLGDMYHPSGNANMRALMPNENTDVMR